MSAHARSARRLAAAVALVLGGYAVTALAATGGQTAGTPALAPTAATAAAGAPAGSPQLRHPAFRAAQARRTFSTPTTSSPISMSRDGRLVWVVNPGADNVSVISTATNAVVRTITVGDEPQSVALDPSNRFAFVANAAAGTVSAILIANPSPTNAFRARVVRTLQTGAEPWNIVASPDGRRVFVANSGQDTITVIDALRPRIIGDVNLRAGRCNPDANQHFQPRGLAVTRDSRRLLVTSFLAFTRPGGRQGDDTGKQGIVCRLSIDTRSNRIARYRPRVRIALAPQVTGFTVDNNGDGIPDPTSAFPNQLQSIVIRGGQAYVPNIAASPDGPQRFNVTTQAFLNVINNVRRGTERDAAPGRFLNLHLGARVPEAGKKRLFFANPWAIGFTTQSGNGFGYVVSAASDLLVKIQVGGDGRIAFTGGPSTTRYIDLDDPANPATSGPNAGKNPQGIVVNRAGTRAYVNNFVSRNVSVVDLANDRVIRVIPTAAPAPVGSPAEVVSAGADMFFSSRGNFNRPPTAAVSTSERLSSDGWQACSSCHFKGLTDGVIWEFPAGPRKSVPLNATFDPRNRAEQRVLNYSAIFDEVEDFDINVRNVSGPGPLAAAVACSAPPPATATNDPAHGLIIGDNGDVNMPPCVINAFAKPNAGRPQVTVTPPGSTTAIPALTALREWVRAAVRTPNGPLSRSRRRPFGSVPADVAAGRALFEAQGCASCHGGGKWSASTKDFTSPPAATEIFTETAPPPRAGTSPAALQYLNRFLRDVGSFNRGVPGAGNELPPNVGATEKAAQGVVNGVAGVAPDALGIDYNGDGKGIGFNPPSLLGIFGLPPYYHNGACETIACVVGDVKHRTANGKLPDRITSPRQLAQLVAFVESISAGTPPFP